MSSSVLYFLNFPLQKPFRWWQLSHTIMWHHSILIARQQRMYTSPVDVIWPTSFVVISFMKVLMTMNKLSMKRAGLTLGFVHDNANTCREKMSLAIKRSGHYVIPITLVKYVITKQNSPTTPKMTLTFSDTKYKKTLKLHCQFVHLSEVRSNYCSFQMEDLCNQMTKSE